ncbi:MAG: hypothetical protein M1835_004498 [Candelina submexicana]|nr:MAG: hypothetical protein M1835_004498 [Candelina submexicana]
MSTGFKSQSWLGLDPSVVKGKIHWKSYEPKAWEETTVDTMINIAESTIALTSLLGSLSREKKADALKIGADTFITTDEDTE